MDKHDRSKGAFALVFLSLFAASAARADAYKNIAKELAQIGRVHLSEMRIAVLPFDYIDGRQSPGGRVVAENLLVNFTKQPGYTVIERVQVEKILAELKFQRTGVIDAATVKEIGRGLGVPAIVMGTLQSLPSGTVLINAKLIETETFKVAGATQEKVKPTWSDYSGTAEQESVQSSYGRRPTPRNDERAGPDSFADIFYGYAPRIKSQFGVRFSRLKRWGGFDLELLWKLSNVSAASDFLLKIPISDSESFFPYGGVGLEYEPARDWANVRGLGGIRVMFGTVGLFTEWRIYGFNNGGDMKGGGEQSILGGLTYNFPH